MALLNEEQKKKVAAAVSLAEEKTAGELVVVQAKSSDDYAFRRSLLALVLSLGVTHEVSFLLQKLPLAGSLGGILAIWGLVYFILGLGPILRLIIPRSVQAEKTSERALWAFMETGVTETRDRSGVLIFLSEAEHRAIILADKGINERVDADEWQKDVDKIVQGIRKGDPAGALLEVIERVGEILAEAFPPREDDENELSNEVREL